jgi:hypothetical protein
MECGSRFESAQADVPEPQAMRVVAARIVRFFMAVSRSGCEPCLDVESNDLLAGGRIARRRCWVLKVA